MHEQSHNSSGSDSDDANHGQFTPINAGYNAVFKAGKLTIGLTCPIEAYPASPIPKMDTHLERVRLAEVLGFSAIWLRDVPFNVPSFGDAGQCFDPFVYLGYLAGNTSRIALGVASLILPVRHPAHVAKAAASVDVLSGGRLILGVASGDRPEEYPALNIPYHERGTRFQDSFTYIRRVSEDYPVLESSFGVLSGNIDVLPKPGSGQLPLLITGGSQQSPEWVARKADGWMIYPRDIATQERVVTDWQTRVAAAGRPAQPVMQPLYIDLADFN